MISILLFPTRHCLCVLMSNERVLQLSFQQIGLLWVPTQDGQELFQFDMNSSLKPL